MSNIRESYSILGREIELHDTGYKDGQGRPVHYETTIEAIGNDEGGQAHQPRSWRVWGRQLRGGRPLGRPSAPLHVHSVREARTLARTLFHKHRRYVERNVAKYEIRASAAEEDLNALAARI